MRYVNADCTKATLKDGIITIPTEFGYSVSSPLTSIVSVDEKLVKGIPSLNLLDLQVSRSSVTTQLTQDQDTVYTQGQLSKYLGNSNYIPETWVYDDFMVGFIYEDPRNGNPDNFKWMFQFRVNDQVISPSMTFAEGVDITCATSTFSWFERGSYHGRMIINRADIDRVVQSVPERVKIIGKCGGYSEGNISLIPKNCNTVSIKFNIHKNRWYLHFLDGTNDLGNELEAREIITDVPMEAHTDRNSSKPKVTERIKKDDIASLTINADFITILGK